MTQTSGWLVAVGVFFLVGPGSARADILSFCGIAVAVPGVHIINFNCVTAGGGRIKGTETEIHTPTFNAIILSPITVTAAPRGLAAGVQQELFTASYATFIGPGIDRATINGSLTPDPVPPPPAAVTIGVEFIFEADQGTTFNNNSAVASGAAPAGLAEPVPFSFTQTKEGDYNGAGIQIVGFQFSLPAGEQFILPGSVVGVLQVVPEPATLLLLLIGCLGVLGYGWRLRARRNSHLR